MEGVGLGIVFSPFMLNIVIRSPPCYVHQEPVPHDVMCFCPLSEIQQDATGYVAMDGGIVQGAFFRRAAREQNEAMRSICSLIEVLTSCLTLSFSLY